MNDRPTVQVVVLDLETPAFAIEAAESALASNGINVHVTVLDNGCSTDHSSQFRRTLPASRVNVLRNARNRGFAGGVNDVLRAVDRSEFEAIVLLNSDARLHADAIATMLRELNDEQVAAVAPAVWTLKGDVRTLEGLGDRIDWWRGRSTARYRGMVAGEFSGNSFDAEWLSGACLMLRPSALSDVGLLDEEYFAYFEETDWCVRASRLGWRLRNCPRAEADHMGRRSTQCARWLYLILRNNVLFMRKRARRRYLVPFFAYWWLVQVPNLSRWCVLKDPRGTALSIGAALSWQFSRRRVATRAPHTRHVA